MLIAQKCRRFCRFPRMLMMLTMAGVSLTLLPVFAAVDAVKADDVTTAVTFSKDVAPILKPSVNSAIIRARLLRCR
jgi:hypothetical protein